MLKAKRRYHLVVLVEAGFNVKIEEALEQGPRVLLSLHLLLRERLRLGAAVEHHGCGAAALAGLHRSLCCRASRCGCPLARGAQPLPEAASHKACEEEGQPDADSHTDADAARCLGLQRSLAFLDWVGRER